VGLCCVALPFSRSADFGHDKPAGEPCRHLGAGDRCGIHARLVAEGYRGCAAYECDGAGPRVTAAFAGATWRDDGVAGAMFSAFAAVRALHELLRHLSEAAGWPSSQPMESHVRRLLAETAAAAAVLAGQGDPGPGDPVDVARLRAEAGRLLGACSDLARTGRGAREDLAGADLAGRDLRGADLRGASLRGALLVGARLGDADLRYADLLGADLRGADLRGTDLRDALFLTTAQLASARGDRGTRLSARRARPSTWP
jgi:hypothetical protein